MHVVLLPFGSAGDVFPFLWLGRLLKARGHQVTLVTACLFEDTVRRAGLEMVPVGQAEDFERLISDPRLWQLYHGTRFVFELAGENTGPVYEILQRLIQEGRRPDLLVAPCTAFGARLAREKFGIPLVTVHVQPAVMISAYEPPVLLPGMEHVRLIPLWLRKLLVRLPDPAQRFSGPAVRRACERHQIPPPKSVWWGWAHSPDGVLALFPEWFAQPQPDWPEETLCWDFPLEDAAPERPLDERTEAFLASGPAPVVFTPGSANVQAKRFFEVALQAIQALKSRAIFVTRDLSQLPSPLPPEVLGVEYAPFSQLIPRAAAFVHHGGIGTLSQGLAAGVPQLVMAMAHDQPDNAWRLRRLGAGLSLSPRTFTPARVQSSLQRLLTEPAFQNAARACQDKFSRRPEVEALVSWLETRKLTSLWLD